MQFQVTTLSQLQAGEKMKEKTFPVLISEEKYNYLQLPGFEASNHR